VRPWYKYWKVNKDIATGNSYVFIDIPVFIPWTHQMKVISRMRRAKLDIYVFIDFPVFIPWTHLMKVIPETRRTH
jgi:hypothetical protein